MPDIPMRTLFGFIAGAISVLTFHQAMSAPLHFLGLPGLGMPQAYPADAAVSHAITGSQPGDGRVLNRPHGQPHPAPVVSRDPDGDGQCFLWYR